MSGTNNFYIVKAILGSFARFVDCNFKVKSLIWPKKLQTIYKQESKNVDTKTVSWSLDSRSNIFSHRITWFQ